MFKQRHARDVIRKAANAIEAGAFFSRAETDKFASNEFARGYLYTEAMFHQLYALIQLFEESFGQRYWWASPDFLWEEIFAALEKNGSKIGPVASDRCDELAMIRGDGELFKDSARRVAEMDPSVDQVLLANAISAATAAFSVTYRPLLQQAMQRAGFFF